MRSENPRNTKAFLEYSGSLKIPFQVVNPMDPHTFVFVAALKDCDFHGKGCLARYDFKTIMGPWGYGCEDAFKQHGFALGQGRGQKLLLEGEKA